MYENKPHPRTIEINRFIRLSRFACLRFAISISSALGGAKPVFTSGTLEAFASILIKSSCQIESSQESREMNENVRLLGAKVE